jgi:PKD repeat protein
MQADGLRNLERGTNRGDAGDLYPGNTNNRNFNNFTNPSSDLHPTTQGVRVASNVTISNITLNPDSSITFTLGNKAFASFSGGNTLGCVPYTVNFINNSQFANAYKWNFGDGSTEVTDANPTYTFNKTGTFTVKLYVLDSNNAPIDSISQNYVVNQSPVALGNITRINSDSFYFENKSSDFDFVVWRFGTSSNNNQDPFGYSFETVGKVPVNLVAFKSSCTDTFKTEIEIWNTNVPLSKSVTNFSVFPNPFNQSLSIDLESNMAGNAQIVIVDLLGKVVANESIAVTKGSNQVKLASVDLIKEGIYFVKVALGGQVTALKVVKSKN